MMWQGVVKMSNTQTPYFLAEENEYNSRESLYVGISDYSHLKLVGYDDVFLDVLIGHNSIDFDCMLHINLYYGSTRESFREYQVDLGKKAKDAKIELRIDGEHLAVVSAGYEENYFVNIVNQQGEMGIFLDLFDKDGEEHIEYWGALDEEDVLGEEAFLLKYDVA